MHSAGRLCSLVAAVVYIVCVVRLGWVSDDAFIAIRSVDHLVNGHEFAVNVGDRVQSFTSPLWALICIPVFALCRDPFATLVVVGVLSSLALALVVRRAFREAPWQGATVLFAFSASVSFLHYSTSGLENSLAHLLAALFVLERVKNGPGPTRSCFFLAAALFLTRFDYLFLTAPAVLWAILKAPRHALRLAWPAVAFAGAWLAFATVYYGFPLPNTAYAKLNTAIPAGSRWLQGVSYVVDATSRDPLVMIAMLAAVSASVGRRALPGSRTLALGIVAYVIYTISIGGDFMGGRFFTTTYLVAILLVVRVIASVHHVLLPAASLTLIVPATAVALADRRTDPRRTECAPPESGITDERECYVEYTALTQNIRSQKWRRHGYVTEGQKAAAAEPSRVVLWNLVGMSGYGNKDEKHVVEQFALSEPFLARIRFETTSGWRIGHLSRDVPRGYLESLRTGKNVVEAPCLHALYDRLDLVRRGPLWTLPRFKAIWDLNTFHRGCRPE
jgi:arabinofuranosyltransferase